MNDEINLETTEEALFAEMGRLYFKNHLMSRELTGLRAVVGALAPPSDTISPNEAVLDGDDDVPRSDPNI